MSAYESYYNLQKTVGIESQKVVYISRPTPPLPFLQVQKTGTNLETFSSTLKGVEKCLSTTQLQDGDLDQSSAVLDVLDSMTTVRNEYAHLRQDLQDVQQLQREMASTLQYQLRSMTQTYNILKKRIESSHSLPVSLPANPTVMQQRPQMAPPARTLSSLSSSPPSN